MRFSWTFPYKVQCVDTISLQNVHSWCLQRCYGQNFFTTLTYLRLWHLYTHSKEPGDHKTWKHYAIISLLEVNSKFGIVISLHCTRFFIIKVCANVNFVIFDGILYIFYKFLLNLQFSFQRCMTRSYLLQ